MRVSRLVAVVVVVTALWLLAFATWAFRWRHTVGIVTIAGQKRELLFRTDRFTNRVEYLEPTGWKALEDAPTLPSKNPWEEPYPLK
jgi:hypothetical protein